MIIELYKNIDDRNVVDKTITLQAELTGDLREGTDILDPVFEVQNAGNIITGGNINYAYIPDFKRYYFINDIKFNSNTLFSIFCHVDVLMTYKAEIRENSALVLRQEFNYNAMLSDPKIKYMANPLVQALKFPNALDDDYTYVLLVAGNSEDV